MAGPGGPTVAGHTAIGADMAMVVRGTGIAQAGPIGAVRCAATAEAATVAVAGFAAASAVVSTEAEASAAVADSTAEVASMAVAATEAAVANLI